MSDTRHVHATYDPEAGVWWAESDDLPGLVSEAQTLDALIERVTAVAADLLTAQGVKSSVKLEFLTTRTVEMA